MPEKKLVNPENGSGAGAESGQFIPSSGDFIAAASAVFTEPLGAANVQLRSHGGRCATAAVTAGKHCAFIKLTAADNQLQLNAEQAGITAIAATNTLRVPAILGSGSNESIAWLAFEALALQPLDQVAGKLGEQLAALHQVSAPYYGWPGDGFIGDNDQPNDEASDWVEFFRDQRLGYQLQLALSQGYDSLAEPGFRLLDELPQFFAGYAPRPSLLHGDLWPGNSAGLSSGEPVIFDPAAYYGDCEAELGMCELFGGYPPAFWQAYTANQPLDAGYAIRRYLYRLYHLLNHLTLFGPAYEAKSLAVLRRLNAELR